MAVVWITIGFVAGYAAAVFIMRELARRTDRLLDDAIGQRKRAELLHARIFECFVKNEELGKRIDERLREMREAGN